MPSSWGRAASHSNSVGSRFPAQRAKASASSQETWRTGAARSIGSRSAHRRPRPVAVAGRLPVHRRLGPGVLDELDVGAVAHRRPLDLERGELDLVLRPLVVIGEAPTRRPDRVFAGLDPDRLRPLGGEGARRLDRGGRAVVVDQHQQLQHRLVVLELMREQHLVDEPLAQQRVLVIGVDLDLVEDLEGALADVGEVGAELLVAEDRQLAARLSRVLDRVVEAAELAPERLAVADRLDQPELLEVGDVAEVPGERAEQRRVDPVELAVVERLDQVEGALARLREPVRDRCPWSLPSPRWRCAKP